MEHTESRNNTKEVLLHSKAGWFVWSVSVSIGKVGAVADAVSLATLKPERLTQETGRFPSAAFSWVIYGH